MRGYGYDPGPNWSPDYFPKSAIYAEDAAQKARKNAPGIILRDAGLILAVALGIAFIVNILLFVFDVG